MNHEDFRELMLTLNSISADLGWITVWMVLLTLATCVK